jgi:serine/threonine-protein kinase
MAADPPNGRPAEPLAETVRERRQVETIDGVGPPLAPPTEAKGVYARGDRLAHFIVVDRIGEGGMGTVVSAYDPDLDRKVAIKVLRGDRHDDEEASGGQQRLLREAQAMARLSHPNVVAVHEVGTVNDRVFIAMEFIDGQTLGAWRKAETRPWREIVAVFVQAGQGLAAAHAAGLVHRDFKPDNVLVRKDGRVVVTDFGLAATSAAIVPAGPGISGLGGTPLGSELRERLAGATPLASPLTREGVLLGTPAYMAPEQYGTTRVDAKADQFSFCVALYEALYGERPFQGDTIWELMGNVALGKRRPVPSPSPVPPWVRDAVVKGPAPAPAPRHSSMEALLQALTSDPGARRWRRLRIAAVSAGFAVLAGLAVAGMLDTDAPPCRTGRSDLAGAWDGATRTAVRAVFVKTRRPYAAETVVKLEQLLDDYAAAWAAMRNEACAATEVKRQQPARTLALRMQCLDQRRAQLAALTALLRQGVDVALLDNAVAAAYELKPLGGCADVAALSRAPAPPADKAVQARVDALRRRVFDAEMLGRVGRTRPGLAAAAAAVEEARRIGHRPTLAEALLVLGRLQAGSDDPSADATLRQAAAAAAEARADALSAQVWIELLGSSYARRAGDLDVAMVRLAAEGDVARTGDELLQARLLLVNGLGLGARGEASARDQLEQALAIRERRLGAEHYALAEPLEGLGALLARGDDFAAAAAHYQRAVRVRIRTQGANHPAVARCRLPLGEALRRAGKLADAQRQFERALAVAERAGGPGHPDVTAAAVGLGAVQLALARSLADTDRARALKLATDAKATLLKAGPAGKKELAAVEEWLKRRGR